MQHKYIYIYIILQTILECMYLSNTVLFDGSYISSIYYIRYNYMFWRLTMAIFKCQNM